GPRALSRTEAPRRARPPARRPPAALAARRADDRARRRGAGGLRRDHAGLSERRRHRRRRHPRPARPYERAGAEARRGPRSRGMTAALTLTPALSRTGRRETPIFRRAVRKRERNPSPAEGHSEERPSFDGLCGRRRREAPDEGSA